jgi:hypothetical protein
MKTSRLAMILASALILAPVAMTTWQASAADAAEAPAKPKKKLPKKPNYVNKFIPAQKVAEANDEPIVVFMMTDSPKSKFIEQKVMKYKPFFKDLAPKNLVLLTIKLKPDGKDLKKIDLKRLKEPERKIIENFGVDPMQEAAAKKKNETITAADAKNYPAVVVISPDATRALFRMPEFDTKLENPKAGFAVWLSAMVDNLRTKGIEPTLSKEIEKILENPMGDEK